MGRGALIVVEENYSYPARIDPHSSDLAAADVAHPEVVDDIVDEIIEIALAKGGRATIVPDGTIAPRGGSRWHSVTNDARTVHAAATTVRASLVA